MKPAVALVAFTTVTFLLGATPVLALDASLHVSQYAHTAWTVRDGFSQTQHQSRLFRVDPGVDPTEVTFVGPLGGTGTIVFARFGPEFVAQTS